MSIGPGGPPDELNVGDLTGRVREREYHIATEREKIRGRLAQLVVAAVVVYPILAFALLVAGRITVQDLPALAGVTAPLAGIAGAAIGFYFGGDERRR